ncbi:MAG: FGGY family carbohydrate kinase, partial [Methylocystis sp.]
MSKLLGALDQGTTSTRFVLIDAGGDIIAQSQREHRQIYPRPGWVEHDAAEIWRNALTVIEATLAKAKVSAHNLSAVGVTNQRETTVLWDAATGAPLHNAIVWMDTRTQAAVDELAAQGMGALLRAKTGLPLATYFSALKLRWLLDEIPDARARAARGEALFGTIDSWIVWNLTGGPRGGRHIIDATNASRT